METSVSSQLDSSLNDSVTDGEDNQSETSPSPADHDQVSLAAESSGVTVVQLSDGQTVQVQGVIQAPQTSVIQSPQVQTVQIATVADVEEDETVADVQKRREILTRRPSYRKILNELSSDSPAVPKIDEENTEDEPQSISSTTSASAPTSIYQTSSGQYIAISQGRAIQLTNPGVEALQGAQTLTMTSSAAPQPGATILQCAAQPGDSPQQFYLQGGQMLIQAATGDIPAYQLRSPNSGLAQSIVMAASPGGMQSPSSQHAEEITRKREVRLMKNREAARECRRKKKEYVKCLENRVAVLENQNKTLIEELKALAPSSPAKSAPTQPHSSTNPKPELRKDSSSPERRNLSSEPPQSLEETAENGGSFSVRRSRRLASFPSRFAKRLRPARAREGEDREERDEGRAGVKLLPTQAGGGTTTEMQPEQLVSSNGSTATTEPTKPCCHEKRACLCLPLNPKSTGESQYSTKPFEQTLSVDLCGTAGLTPPTTPPHKPVEDELFKPTEGGKSGGGVGGGSSGDGGGGNSESVHPASNTNVATKGSSWLSRAHHQRKLPEQTELYAQLRRMGQAGDSDTHRHFGDHDYCVLSLGESRKRSAAILDAMLQAQGGSDGAGTPAPKAADDQVLDEKEQEDEEGLVMSEISEPQDQETTVVISFSPPSDCQSAAATPPASEEEAERSSASRSPSPTLHLCPDSPSSKTDSSENSEICPDDKQRNKAKSDEENCQVFYIHNLPSSVTQNMLRKRFQVFGKAEDCKVIICNEERCGVIKIRQSGGQRHWRERETVFQNGPAGVRRVTRKRYIDLDEAGPGPVKSKYDALDFDTLLKEAQKSLHR